MEIDDIMKCRGSAHQKKVYVRRRASSVEPNSFEKRELFNIEGFLLYEGQIVPERFMDYYASAFLRKIICLTPSSI